MVAMGLVFLYSGRVETVVFDRQKQAVLIYRFNLVCAREARRFDLSDVKDVRAAKRGVERNQNSTIRYRITVRLVDGREVSFLETSNSTRVRKQVSIASSERVSSFSSRSSSVSNKTTAW
jgi:hypothetical protein